MCHLFLLHDDFLLQNLHGVDALCISLPNLIDLPKRPFANEPEDLKVAGSEVLSLRPLIKSFNVYLARRGIFGHCIRMAFQRKPGPYGAVMVSRGLKVDVTQKFFARGCVVVYRDIDQHV